MFFGLRAAEAGNLPPLTEAQKNKLRHLSVVTLASKLKVAYLSFPCLFCSLFLEVLWNWVSKECKETNECCTYTGLCVSAVHPLFCTVGAAPAEECAATGGFGD